MSQSTILKKLTSKTMQEHLKKCNIEHLWIFGSRAKESYKEDSDIDLLYQLVDIPNRDGLAFFRGIWYIKDVLWTENIDFVSIEFIHPDIREEVLSSKIALW